MSKPDDAAIARLLVLGVLLLGGCASLPRTNLPICAEHPEVVCISSVDAERDYKWEKVYACPWPPETRHAPCYEHAGARDDRQVYRFRWYE